MSPLKEFKHDARSHYEFTDKFLIWYKKLKRAMDRLAFLELRRCADVEQLEANSAFKAVD
jgi:hypothetical protein